MSKKLRFIILILAVCFIGLGLMMSFVEPGSIPTEPVEIPLNLTSSTSSH